VHVGDFTTLEVIEELRALAPLQAVHGNVDELAVRRALPEQLVVEAEGLRIGLVHDAGPAADRPERLLARFPGCELIVYGHTHRPKVTRVGESWIVNPGSPTERRRAPCHTMAVVRAGRPELVHLD
jgi:uncharacterized protein